MLHAGRASRCRNMNRLNAWQPPHRFVDEQLRGPYRLWIHEHTFEPRNGGTLARDLVRYAVPFDALLHRWFVRPEIERIFQFRAAELNRRFAAAAEFSHEEGVRKL